jgi:N-acetylneuraminic acid mutarotase
MIVWGGSSGSTYFNNGGRYDPSSNSWLATESIGSPTARSLHSAIWTGSEMLVWGGVNGSTYSNDTFSYSPSRLLQIYQRP